MSGSGAAGVPRVVVRALGALARAQTRSPWWFVGFAAALVAGSIPLVSQLGLRGDLTALLPDSAPAVIDLDRLQDRLGRATTLAIAVHGAPRADLRTFVRALSEDLEDDVPDHVLTVDWNAGEMDAFIEEHKYLFADLDELEEIRDALDERKEYETARSNPFYVQLDDEEPPTFDELVGRLREREREADEARAFRSGFFEHREMRFLVVFLRTDVRIGEQGPGRALANEILARVERVKRETGLAAVKVDLGADLMDSVEEAEALVEEVAMATALTAGLVLLSVYLFYLSFRSIPLLGLSLAPPVIVTFAFAELSVDYLNSSSAFLGSIVIGNGINPMIIWLARYYEERRDGHEPIVAIEATHVHTVLGTVTASFAAAVAYGSLMITDFRGFRDFGIIGGFGMVVCWLATLLLLPALAAVFDRMRPIPRREAGRENIYGKMFRWLALAAPRTVAVLAVLLTAVSGVVVYRYVTEDPLEYDFRNLQSERDPHSRIAWVNLHMGEIVSESFTGSAMAMLVPDRALVEPTVARIERVKERRPHIIGEIHSIQNLLPPNQEEKIEALAGIRALLLDLRRHADDRQQREIDRHVPPAEIRPIVDADLPETAARAFTESDGSIGRVIFIGHDHVGSSWDGKFMLKWAGAVREVRLPDGTRPPVTGHAAVFADLLQAIFTDAPKAVTVALLLTALLVIVSFRRWRDRLYTLAPLFAGILWMTAAMALFKIKLNFLNFLAYPITIGNGVDYSVNYMQRYVQEEALGGDAVRRSVEATGGAVVLCSLTTVIGYISLYASSNQALNSFGAAMSISELACVLAAIVSLPAILSLRVRRTEPVATTAPTGAGQAESGE